MMIIAPVIGSKSGELLLHFYDWDSGGTGEGEGAGFGGAILGVITFVNGALIILTTIIMFIIRVIRKQRTISS
ncbi:hypothetical protein [Sporosarcina sp. D27]|uniref:hypothetical protein n=1 Tax=Sporosarcina sp. D27 TaxID=1382305 RepID=UPI00209EA9B5|nr:hypothetical protein [Sporosarcina sp. D27]